jgi:hypothetical protein
MTAGFPPARPEGVDGVDVDENPSRPIEFGEIEYVDLP